MHNKAYYKYVEEDAGAQAKSYEKYNTGAKGDKGAKGAKARRCVFALAISRFCRHPAPRASFCQKQGAKEPAGAKGAGAKAGEKASAKTSGDEVWSKETDYL